MGQHGGGTFLLVYIPCLFLVAFPLMMSELMIGRQGRSNPVHAIINVARLHKLKIAWQIIGWLGIITSFLIFFLLQRGRKLDTFLYSKISFG